MSINKPTEAEANELVEMEKIILGAAEWKQEGKCWRIKARVLAVGQDYIFDIAGYVGGNNYGFTLLYQNYPIRKFNKHSPHRIGGMLYRVPHKHVWNGETENAKAYIPDDINPDDDRNLQFLAFCKECNITILGAYQHIVFPGR